MFEENEISEKAFGGTELTKRGLAKTIDPALLDNFQIICSRVRDLKEDKIRIYWCHDTEHDPECNKIKDASFRDQFHAIVFTSEYQYRQFQTVLGLPYDEKFTVIESCIDPIEVQAKPKDTINLIYTSTPQRGLTLLLPVVDMLAKNYPEIHLHVFSSFKLYGWDEMDKKFEPMYDFIRNHANMTYHEFSGARSNFEVRDQLKRTHIFGYPCIHPETFCRSLVEAMSASALCIHPNYAALPFTSGGLNIMYPGSSDHQKHCTMFGKHLDIGIRMIRDAREEIQPRLTFNKTFVDTSYSTDVISKKWLLTLTNLVHLYPDVASRKKAAAMFHYSSG